MKLKEIMEMIEKGEIMEKVMKKVIENVEPAYMIRASDPCSSIILRIYAAKVGKDTDTGKMLAEIADKFDSWRNKQRTPEKESKTPEKESPESESYTSEAKKRLKIAITLAYQEELKWSHMKLESQLKYLQRADEILRSISD